MILIQYPLYLDGHATTSVDPRVVDAMLPYFTQRFGNPSSLSHAYGWDTEAAVKMARATVAEGIGAEPEEIIFTSGATEANNLAIKGVAESYLSRGRHFVTVATEHSAVLEPCHYLQTLGFDVTILGVQENGLIALSDLEQSLRPDTILVSVMAANNETGVLQPLDPIGQLCRDRNVLFHTDAAQALGKIPLNVNASCIDLMSLTAHKLYGPKGIGALYVRRQHPRVQLAPQFHGGGQEQGVRPGTLNPPLIVGFAEAVAIALSERDTDAIRLLQLREHLWRSLKVLPDIYLNGDWSQRLPGNLNISIAGVEGAALLRGIQSQIAVSSGSACASGQAKPSHVLQAMGRSAALASASLRFGIGRYNTSADIEVAAKVVLDTIQALRRIL
jgi:cysteine desulfurase